VFQGRGLFTHALLCRLKAQLVLARCLAVRSPRLPALALAQAGLAHVQEALREPARQKPARSRARAAPRDAKPAARAPPAVAERSARRKGTRVGRRVTILRTPQVVLLPPALTAAELPPAALRAVANAVARVNAATAAGGAEAVEAAAAVACRAGRRAERVERLIAGASAAGLSDEQRLALAVQAKALQLAPVQARIRAQVECSARGIDTAGLQRAQPTHLAERAALAVRAPAVPAAELARGAAAHAARCAKADAARRSRNAGVLQAHASIAAAAEARRAQARAERLAALKAHDYDAYLKLVRHGDTTARIRSLLSRTDAYLNALGRKLTALRGGDGAGEEELPASAMLRATLRPYQQAGVRWLVSLFRNGLNGCLADEMGLGKTVQVIALLCHLVENEGLARGPFLIVVPASVLPNWASELARWAPQLDVAAYTGPEAARTAVFNTKMARGRFQICLTTFEMVMNAKDVPRLSRIKWSYLIMDEAHRIKNASCRLSRELEKYRFGRRLLLTGTPVQNNLAEMFTLLQFLMPTVFNTDAEEFIALFDKPFDGDGAACKDGGGSALNEEERLLLTTRMHEALRPFMLRRVKEKVAADLPSKREVLVPCAPSGYQEHLCRIVKEKAWSSVATAATAGAPKQRAVSVNNAIMELRVLCNHPFLSRLHDTAEEEALGPHPVSSLVRHCGKLETLDRMLPKLKAAGHRVLLFCTMTRLLDVMEEYLASRGFTYLRLDGTTGGAERGEVVREFQAQDSSAFVFLLSVRAGGFGLNLQSADTVIMFDTGATMIVLSCALASLSPDINPPLLQTGIRRLMRRRRRGRTASGRRRTCWSSAWRRWAPSRRACAPWLRARWRLQSAPSPAASSTAARRLRRTAMTSCRH
jgi:superfamily II DNA or RNA helicase